MNKKDIKGIIKNDKQNEINTKTLIITSSIFIAMSIVANYIDKILSLISIFFHELSINNYNMTKEFFSGLFLLAAIVVIVVPIYYKIHRSGLKRVIATYNKDKLLSIVIISIIFTVTIILIKIYFMNVIIAILGIAATLFIRFLITLIYKIDNSSFIDSFGIYIISFIDLLILSFTILIFQSYKFMLLWPILTIVFVGTMNIFMNFKFNIDETLLVTIKILVAFIIALVISSISLKMIFIIANFICKCFSISDNSNIFEKINYNAFIMFVFVLSYWVSSALITDVIFKNYLSNNEYMSNSYNIKKYNNLTNLIFMILIFVFIKVWDTGLEKYEADMICDAITLVSLLVLFIDKRNV